jgi:putative DNA primase/helicase
VHEATGWPVAVAFDAGNLESVALAIRAKHPDLPLSFAADHDVTTEGNPGLSKANAAAAKVGGVVASPEAIDGLNTDWNDVHAKLGIERVSGSLHAAIDQNHPGLSGQPGQACNHGLKHVPDVFEAVPDAKKPGTNLSGFYLETQFKRGIANGVYFQGKPAKPDQDPPAPVWICSPLEIEADTRDEANSKWGRLLVFADRDGKVHRWSMPMELTKGSGEELRGELLNQGLLVANGAAGLHHPSAHHAKSTQCQKDGLAWARLCVA